MTTSAAIVLESSQNINCESCEQYRQLVLPIATRKLVECATPDSILRLKYTDLEDAKQIQDLYFFEQKHNSLDNLLQEVMEQQKKESTARPCLQVLLLDCKAPKGAVCFPRDHGGPMVLVRLMSILFVSVVICSQGRLCLSSGGRWDLLSSGLG